LENRVPTRLRAAQGEFRNSGKAEAQLRKFGIGMTIIFSVLGAIGIWRGRHVAPSVFFLAAVLALLTAIGYPRGLAPVYRAWMTLARALAWINTRIILFLLFYVVVTPVGMVMRLFGRDPLKLKLDRSCSSYWITLKPSQPAKDRYEHLF
jgi:hypothetical protein